jgi:HSP20 family protein
MKVSTKRNLPRVVSDWQDWMDDFFNLSPTGLLNKIGITTPAVNIREDEKAYIIEVAAPGMEKEDFKLAVNRDSLTISCEKKTEKEDADQNYQRREFSFSSFRRTFTLPEDVDRNAIEAQYQNGVLFVKAAKLPTGQVAEEIRTISVE